uniref:UspA domain-containing protein n=1 Tax=Oryza glumipatula TaxID=40148 RepID=A0A0E0BT18_9ORYZ
MAARSSLPSFCLHRIRSDSRSGAPPSIRASSTGAANDGGRNDDVDGKEEEQKSEVGRKVMVVADGGSDEARTALQWALSHSVRPCDTVVLLDVVKSGDDPSRGCQHLETMRSICQAKRPEVRVELSLVEGKERGPVIVEAARKQGVSLLVMGQKKRSITWRLLVMWMTGGKGGGRGTAEYCVQNAACMALAVRRKSRRGGGYLITTRRQRDFWLLA